MRSLWIISIIVVICLLLALAYKMLFKQKPITVGIITSLTSGTVVASSEFNSAELYVEETKNCLVHPVAINDNWDPQLTVEVTQAKINKGFQFFITSHPSKCAVASKDLFNNGKAININCASTSPELTGKDDFIFRIISDSKQEQQAIAEYVNQLKGSKLLIIQDDGNSAYTEPAFKYFSEALKLSGKWTITQKIITISKFKPDDFKTIFEQEYDVLYILGGSFQSSIGNIAQYFHLFHPHSPIILTPWARSASILDISGPALANIILTSSFPANSESDYLKDYITRFKNRFSYSPHSMNYCVRQAMELMDQAFQQGCKTPLEVKRYFLSKPVHHTTLGDISFDQYGDVKQKYYFIRNLESEF